MKLSAPINTVLLAGLLSAAVSCKTAHQAIKDNDAYIARNLLEHTIVNKSLKDELIRYDNRFKDFEDAQGKGLRISLEDISPDSTVYNIGYMTGLNYSPPVLSCEPVNGKPVSLWLSCLEDFKLPPDKSIEVLKNTSPEEYEIHRQNRDAIEFADGVLERHITLVLSDFVSLRLVYDRDHNLIRRDTIGWYK